MASTSPGRRRHWVPKFGHALRGCRIALRRETSFWVHVPCACAVLTAGAILGWQPWQWCAVLGCITAVLVAEMLNTALEALARAVDPDVNPHLRDALDTGSAAVLLAALGAAAVGAVVFLS